MKKMNRQGQWTIDSCNVRTTIVSDETPVCNLFNLGEETEANAKLIAASPELLETLSQVEAVIRYNDDVSYMLSSIQKVIEKATR